MKRLAAPPAVPFHKREGEGSGVDREEAGKKIEEVRRGGSGRCGFGRSLLFLPYYDKKSSDE